MLKRTIRGVGLLLMLGAALPAHAIILFGLDNSANQTDPATGAPFGSVAEMASGSISLGSAVYLGNGYMLTANHVTMTNFVSFDGETTLYAVDNSFTPVQVAGNVDMKIFRLANTAIPIAPVNLWNQGTTPTGTGTIVGTGLGRDAGSVVGSNSVNWGDTTTEAKRWGLNDVAESGAVAYQSGSYSALITVLGSSTGIPPGLGSSEAALTEFDSGGALFQEISGTWYLTGLATGVDVANTSTYGNDATIGLHGDFNYFAEIGPMEGNIAALTVVPEPGMSTIYAGLFALLAGGVSRRKRVGK